MTFVLLLSDVTFYHLAAENLLLFLTLAVVSGSKFDLFGTLRCQFFYIIRKNSQNYLEKGNIHGTLVFTN